MKASLVLNEKDQVALFYTEPLETAPEWASIDVEMGQIFLGGEDMDTKNIMLDNIKTEIYERIKAEAKILLVRVQDNKEKTPVEAQWIPATVATQTTR